MKNEKRFIKASFMTGLSEILLGLGMAITGWHEWYFVHFHFFGVLGIGMAMYGMWHGYFYWKEKRVKPW